MALNPLKCQKWRLTHFAIKLFIWSSSLYCIHVWSSSLTCPFWNENKHMNGTFQLHFRPTYSVVYFKPINIFFCPHLVNRGNNKSSPLDIWGCKLVKYQDPLVAVGPFTLAKTKIPKTWVFCCTVYTARKTHNFSGFWQEKRMREKTWISYCFFGKWCTCAISLYLWPYQVHITSRAAGDSAEGHVPRDQKPE